MKKNAIDELSINTIRLLSADAIQEANSGHPGLPMGTAPMAYVLWNRHLRHNPSNPKWPDRDRFVLSGGHGSMLLYSLLHLTGYDLSIEEIKNFRQWGSLTPGHPEFGLTPGVETTTGPLGQGFANGVGMAMAEAHLARVFNRPGHKIIDHTTYGIVTDGDLMEGVSAEAASLAGTLKLGKLIYLYDDNQISIEGSTEITFREDTAKRFEAYGWYVQQISDALDIEEIDRAIQAAKKDPRPSLICVPNVIGFGLPSKAGTASAHGEPPGEDELKAAKQSSNWPLSPRFYIPDEVLEHFRKAKDSGKKLEQTWQDKMTAYQQEYPKLAEELKRRLAGDLPENWAKDLPIFPTDAKGIASRKASGTVIDALSKTLPELMGGSADLAPSTKTWMDKSKAFFPENSDSGENDYDGRNINFGVREHAMGSIVNGLAYHGGIIPFGATFLVFSDYMRPAIRLAALSHLGTIFVFTHDSIGVGEDGPTHQPVEHVAALRSIPNLLTIRPGDANEVRIAWEVAIENRHRPTALALTRQNLTTLDRSVFASAEGLRKGAYVLADLGEGYPDIILMASGSEVGLIVDAGKELAEKGLCVRIVSFPCWELFLDQDEAYRNSVLPPKIEKRLAVEAGVTLGWHRWVGSKGLVVGIDRFGASAPGAVVFKKLGFSTSQIVEKSLSLVRTS